MSQWNRMVARKTLMGLFALFILSPGKADGDDIEEIEADLKRIEALNEQKRRTDAAEELGRVRQRKDEIEQRLKVARDWVLKQFQLDERGLINRPQKVAVLQQRWQAAKEQARHRLLQFPEKASGAIASGNALNRFLEECGAAAFEYESYGKVAKEKDVEILRGVVGIYQLDENIVRHIRFKSGDVGVKYVGRINEEPLDIAHWPGPLKKDQYQRHRASVESARRQALVELKGKGGITGSTGERLQSTIGDFRREFEAEFKEHVSMGVGSAETSALLAARRFLAELPSAVLRLLEAQRYEDVAKPKFNGGTVGQLMAFMYINNLKFHEADGNGQSAYRTIFEMMSRYYVDLESFKFAEDELKTLEQEEKVLRDVALGNTLSNEQRTKMMLKETDAMIEFFKTLQAFSPAASR